MNNDEPYSILYLILLLLLVGGGYLRMRGSPRKELQNAAIWLVVVAVLVIGWSLLH